jgi:hypothetical protein
MALITLRNHGARLTTRVLTSLRTLGGYAASLDACGYNASIDACGYTSPVVLNPYPGARGNLLLQTGSALLLQDGDNLLFQA